MVLREPVGAVLGEVVETAVSIQDDDSQEPEGFTLYLPIIRK